MKRVWIFSAIACMFVCYALPATAEEINHGADIEVILLAPGEMRARAGIVMSEMGLRLDKNDFTPRVITENGPRGLAKIYLLKTDSAALALTLITVLANHQVLDGRRFAGVAP